MARQKLDEHESYVWLRGQVEERARRIAELEQQLTAQCRLNSRLALKTQQLDARHVDDEQQAQRDRERREQLEVQLAGCGVAALGGTKEPAVKGQWGWSPAYQDVLELRLKFEKVKSVLEYLDRQGGLGLDKHEMIRTVLAKKEENDA